MRRLATVTIMYLFSFVMLSSAHGGALKRTDHVQYVSDFLLSHETCFGVQIGYQYLVQNMAMVLESYINRYNIYSDKPSSQYIESTFLSKDYGGYHFKIKDFVGNNKEIDMNKPHPRVTLTEDMITAEFALELESMEKSQDGKSMKAAGVIGINLQKISKKINKNGQEFDVPQLAISTSLNEKGFILSGVSNQQIKSQIEKDMAENFQENVLSIEGEFFDQVSAFRLLKGLVITANEKAESSASVFLQMDHDFENLNLYFSCNQSSLQNIKPITYEQFEFSVGGNFLEWLYLNERNSYLKPLTIDHLIDIYIGMEPFTPDYKDEVYEQLEKYGFANNKGEFTLFQNDREILDQLDSSKFQTPGIHMRPTDIFDSLKIKKQDEIEIKMTNFISFSDPSMKGSALTVIPIEIQYKFRAAFQNGIGSMHGPTAQVATDHVSLDIQLKECQFINQNLQDQIGEDQDSDDDDDDFEDDDDELDNQPSKKQVVPPLAGLLCGMMPTINEKLSSNFTNWHITDLIVYDWIKEYSGNAKRNAWYTFMDTDWSFLLLCSGIQLRQPQPRIENGRFIIGADISDDLLRVDEFCDSDINELKDLHPDLILKNQKEEFYERIEARKANNKLKSTLDYTFHVWFWLWDYTDHPWFLWKGDHHDLRPVSPLMHHVSNYHPIKEYCRKNLGDIEEIEVCTMTLLTFKNQKEFERIDYQGPQFPILYDFKNKESIKKSKDIGQFAFDASSWLLKIGLLLFMLGLNVNKNLMIILTFVLSLGLHVIWLGKKQARYGPDTTAYINQAGQHAIGQTSYWALSSGQGPCYYPAGHILHYLPIYHLYMLTDQGELIYQFLHCLIHTAIITLVAKISYKYFKNDHSKAQLICFLLLQQKTRSFHQETFNDSILELYIILTFFFVSSNKPLKGAFCLTMGLGIKAGVLLTLPGFFGWVQYQHGTIKLALTVLIFLGVQFLLAAPFTCDPISRLLGFKNGAQTPWFDGPPVFDQGYFGLSKLHGGNANERGAIYKNTIYWGFIDEKLYNEDIFSNALKASILGFNIYYFFIRENCFWQCFSNLLNTFGKINSKMTYSAQRKALNIVIVLYLSGVNFVPGGHVQFQIWYLDLIPVAFMMTGINPILWYNVYSMLYPCNFSQPTNGQRDNTTHHIVLLATIGWLLTVGPNDCIIKHVKSVFGSSPKKVKSE